MALPSRPTYDDVFANTDSPEFGKRMHAWLDSRCNGKNLTTLSQGEQILLQIRFAVMDINGNSFPGFFESPPDNRHELFIDALQEIGAQKSADALVQIGEILFDGPIPETLDARADAMDFDDDDEADRFDSKIDECRKIWENTGDDISELGLSFAKNNPNRFR